MRRAQGGETTALNVLFARYYPRVRRVVHARLGNELRRRLEVEDLVQQSFIEAMLGFEGFEMREDASLGRWLNTIATRVISAAADRNHAAMRDPKKEVALRYLRSAMESGELVAEPAADEHHPIDELVHLEDVERVRQAMHELGPAHRRVIDLRLEGMSWEAVAHALDSPSPDAARMLHARAITELTRITRRP